MSKIGYFLAILTVLIFEPFWQIIDNFETAEKDTMRWFLPTFFFSVSFQHWIKLRRIPWREKVHIFPTFWPPKNSQNGQKMRRAKRICFLAVKLLLLQFGRFYLDMEHVKTFVRTALLKVPHFVLYDVHMWTILSVQWSNNNSNYTPH